MTLPAGIADSARLPSNPGTQRLAAAAVQRQQWPQQHRQVEQPPGRRQQPCHRRRGPRPCAAGRPGERQQRDPSRYASLEALQAELQAGRGGVVTGLINWLSSAANARGWVPSNGGSSDGADSSRSSSSSPLQPLQHLYRWLSTPKAAAARSQGQPQEEEEWEVDPLAVQQLQALLLCSRPSTERLIRSCRQLQELDRGELVQRLVWLKGQFPDSDVARMVALQPQSFLGDEDWRGTQRQLAAASSLLRQGLQGADLDFMFQEDPLILFEPPESLQAGLRELHDLWPGLDQAALANSSPLHLGLAVKALGLTGPPKGF